MQRNTSFIFRKGKAAKSKSSHKQKDASISENFADSLNNPILRKTTIQRKYPHLLSALNNEITEHKQFIVDVL